MLFVSLAHRGSLHWCIPRNHGDTRCREVMVQSAGAKGLCIYACHCFLTRCCSPERWRILAGNVDPCARRNTGIPPHSGYRPKLYPLKNTGVTTSTNVRERKRGSQWEVTGASAAIHAVFLTDLLNIETVTGCGAGHGAFTVLHPSWTFGDWVTHPVNLISLFI